jgi:hypothetical protein
MCTPVRGEGAHVMVYCSPLCRELRRCDTPDDSLARLGEIEIC